MSAGRSFRRRQAPQWIWRRPGVEPSAETRAWVGRMLRAHDDPDVTVEQFIALAREWSAFMVKLSEAERMEAASQLNDHAMRNLLGRPVRTIGIERRS